MSNTFEVRYDLNEQIAAYWFFLRKRWLWKGAVRYVAVLGTIIFLIAASEVIRDHGFDVSRLAASALIGLLAGCGGLLILALYCRWNIPRVVRRSFQQLHLEGRSTRYEFDRSRLEIGDQFAGGSLEWHELVRWAENERFVMLYRTDCMFYYIPKHKVDTEMVAALKANLITAAVPAV